MGGGKRGGVKIDEFFKEFAVKKKRAEMGQWMVGEKESRVLFLAGKS